MLPSRGYPASPLVIMVTLPATTITDMSAPSSKSVARSPTRTRLRWRQARRRSDRVPAAKAGRFAEARGFLTPPRAGAPITTPLPHRTLPAWQMRRQGANPPAAWRFRLSGLTLIAAGVGPSFLHAGRVYRAGCGLV